MCWSELSIQDKQRDVRNQHQVLGTMSDAISWIEVDLGDRIVQVKDKSLRLLQAVWRGSVVRRQIAEVRSAFHQVVLEIEGSDDHQVAWSTSCLVSKPQLSRRPAQSRLEENDGVDQADIRTNNPPVQQEQQNNNQVNFAHTDESLKGTKIDPKQQSVTLLVGKSSSRTDCRPDAEAKCSEGRYSSSTQTAASSAAPSATPSAAPSATPSAAPSATPSGTDHGTSPLLQDNTSLWDTTEAPHPHRHTYTDKSEADLEVERSHVAMELLWVQQAVHSRKQYLRLKSQISEQ